MIPIVALAFAMDPSIGPPPSVGTRDIVPCSGEPLKKGSKVRVHYVAKVQGQDEPFDSSRKRDRPAWFTVGTGELIPGWEQGMQGMSVGCTRALIVPPELAYGAKGFPPLIPENATLEFEIELLEIVPGRVPPDAPSPVPSYVTTPSGLQVHDLVVGDGPTPREGQRATVEYTLWLPNGTRVDSSFSRPAAFTYAVGGGQVIKGWEEAVIGMNVGGTRQFRVPYKLGYGVAGRPPTIPAKSELVFEVTLLSVQ